MEKILRILKKRKYICFFDLEGTQHSQEMIAIGAVLCSLDRNGKIKKEKAPFKRYVKAKNKVGRIVVNLTGITDAQLAVDGISFKQTMEDFKKYCGLYWKKCLFVSFGNNDIRILNQTIAYNLDSPKELCSQIHKNYWDFGGFLTNFVRDDKGCMMSLVHYCEAFDVNLVEPHHDPVSDAVNLAHLYQAFLTKKTYVHEQYKKILVANNKIPEPIHNVIVKLANGETVTPDILDEEITKELK
jgi:DNA polymerase III alpha subunit (gram-positive type)